MPSYLVTGSSRGLGLELVKQLARRSDASQITIFATTRSNQPSTQLKEIIDSSSASVKHVVLDVEDQASISSAVSKIKAELGDRGLDVLINNAGIQQADLKGAREMDTLEKHLMTNVVSVHKVTNAFLPLLQKGKEKKIINITSTLGSIAMVDNFLAAPVASYKISKTALNSLTVQYALDLKDEGFTVLAISPGWLKTDLGGPYADLAVEVGAERTIGIIEEATVKDTGRFRNIHVSGMPHYDGKDPAW